MKSKDEIKTLVVDEEGAQMFKLEAQLEEPLTGRLENFLKVSMDMMAYNATEILGIDLDTMVHYLNVQAE